MKIKETHTRHYIFTQKQLKEKLNIKGDIKSFVLNKGLSPNDKENKVSRDTNEYLIVTKELEKSSNNN